MALMLVRGPYLVNKRPRRGSYVSFEPAAELKVTAAHSFIRRLMPDQPRKYAHTKRLLPIDKRYSACLPPH